MSHSRQWRRCKVQAVEDLVVEGKPLKRMCVRLDPEGMMCIVNLLDDWVETVVDKGSIVNIFGNFIRYEGQMPVIEVSLKENALVLHPDILVPVTSVTTSLDCRRRAILSSIFRAGPASDDSGIGAPMYGKWLHTIIQSCMKAASDAPSTMWTEAFVSERVDEFVNSKAGVMACFQYDVEKAVLKDALVHRLTGLSEFGDMYFGNSPKADALIRDGIKQNTVIAITKIYAVEASLHSFTFGLKGRADAVAQVVIGTSSNNGIVADQGVFLAPIEIKTGKSYSNPFREHAAQSLLYAMMLTDGHDGLSTIGGLLLYSIDSKISLHRPGRNETRALIQARNALVSWAYSRKQSVAISSVPKLPLPIDDLVMCTSCRSVDACVFYRNVETSGSMDEVPGDMEDLYSQRTRHITATDRMFFTKWSYVLDMEESASISPIGELWSLVRVMRDAENVTTATFTFKRGTDVDPPITDVLVPGDNLLISSITSGLTAGQGSVINFGMDSVQVHIVSSCGRLLEASNNGGDADKDVYRLARDLKTYLTPRSRYNLFKLVYPPGGNNRWSSFIVHRRAPSFRQSIPDTYMEDVDPSLNIVQRGAVERALAAEDYFLIRGMPGTGKTTVIVQIIKALVRLGKTVLLTSHTHSAVDNVLSKLDGSPFSISRLGERDKIRPDCRKYSVDLASSSLEFADVEGRFMACPLVATTCMSLDHPLLTRRVFDYCIVDEAAQIVLPVCIGPVLLCYTAIFVGDESQLPPLVRSKDVHVAGLGFSLFHRLFDIHPEAALSLVYQYRMADDIMLLSNRLTYQSQLLCASEDVAQRSLVLPLFYRLSFLHIRPDHDCNPCWLSNVLLSGRKVVFVDTDRVPARESFTGFLVQNEVEGVLVAQIVHALVTCGVAEDAIGVISPYRQQLRFLNSLLSTHGNVELLTIDQCQGRDKECIVVSTVRSNAKGNIGLLLRDWRRLNVAFTRARSKLIVLGSRSTLSTDPIFGAFFDIVSEEDWVYELPPDAHAFHAIAITRT